jgi:hypothetical protein
MAATTFSSPYLYLDTTPTSVSVWLAGSPASGDEALVDAAIAAHTGPPAPLKLWRYLPSDERGRDHRVVNYGIGLTARLHEHIDEMFRGEVRRIGFYAPDDHDDEIVRETMVYTRAANGLALSRTTTRTWFREDGTPHPLTKVTVKDYEAHPIHQMQEGVRRRQNVVDELTLQVLGMLVVTQTNGDVAAAEALGSAFMLTHETCTTNYLRNGDNAMLQAEINADTTTWLENDLTALGMPGMTIRQVLVASLAGIMETP